MEDNDKVMVNRTIALVDFQSHLHNLRPWVGQKKLKAVFDEIPTKEIREICLLNITDNEWLIKRIKAYLKINDYETVFMLLRRLGIETSSGDSKNSALQLMIEVAEKCLEDFPDSYYLKDALVILCGKLYNSPELYNERARKLFTDILNKYDRKDRYGTYEKEAQILIRVFLLLSKLGDKSFLGQLRECLPDAQNLKHLMSYSNTCRDEVLADGLRLLLMRHFENLNDVNT